MRTHYVILVTPHASLFCLPVFFFNDTATTEIYTLSLHDALPIYQGDAGHRDLRQGRDRQELHAREPLVHDGAAGQEGAAHRLDRKSTRLNSSHANISYAVFCLKKKNTETY